MSKPTTTPHPLESVVRDAFRKGPAQDRITLATHMKGVDHFTGKDGSRGDKAYLLVAEDVLGCMACQGKLVTDAMGWYRLAPVSKSPRSRKPTTVATTTI